MNLFNRIKNIIKVKMWAKGQTQFNKQTNPTYTFMMGIILVFIITFLIYIDVLGGIWLGLPPMILIIIFLKGLE